MTRVSVILLSYNHAKFIREAIDSTLGQTFADFELIVVDDCSSDNSWELISQYSDQRIKSYRNERNIGGVAGVNRAISELASGELIAIHHSDDVWEPDKLEKQVAFLDARPEMGAVFSDAIAIGEDGALLADGDHFYSSIFSQPNRTRHEWLRFFFGRGNALCHPSVLIRKRVFDDCGLYINGLAQSADFNMWIRVCMRYEIHVLQEKLVRFRVLDNEANASGSRRDSRMRGVYELYKNFDLYLQIRNRDDLFKVFPSMVELDRGDDTDIEFVVAMAAFEEVTFCTKQLFGIDILFKIISDPVRAKKVEGLYGFGLKEFLALTGKYDLFSREEVSDLWKRVQALDAQITSLNEIMTERDQHSNVDQTLAESNTRIVHLTQAVTERDNEIASLNQAVAGSRRELAQVLASKSWLVTKPLRFARRVGISKPGVAARRVLSDVGRALWRGLPLSYERKRAFKGLLFKTAPWAFRWSKAYQAWEAFSAPVDYAPLATSQVRQPTETWDEYVPLIKASPPAQKPAKLICFYLPQFHAIPENDEWWGEGFTEWTNVQPAQPQFEGHYQPHVPGELGYYNLLDPAVQRRQVELAKLYGIGGFCFYFYWFGGKRLLEAPIENYLDDKDLDLPFCLCWANENWSRRWDGLDSEILMAQQHSVEDDLAFIRHVAQYMRDPRYIRINGKPLLLVYRPSLLPSAKETASRWRDWCRANGLGEIYLAYTQSFEAVDPAKYGFDAAIEFPPNNSAPPNITDSVVPMGDNFGSTVYDWRVFVERSEHYKQQPYTLFRSVCPSWDNTARRKNRGTVFLNSTPTLYQRWLKNAIRDTLAHHSNRDERLIFVNAWNEWAEGAHLEPDGRYGYAFLESTRMALLRSTIEAQIDCGRNINASRVAVIVHAYYPELLEEINEFLRESDDLHLHLYVTTTADKVEAVQGLLERQPHNFEVIVVRNHGRDVLPFLHALQLVVKSEHDVILKIHTKKSTHRGDGATWRKDLYQKLLSKDSIKKALSLLGSDANLGILGPDGHIVKMGYYWGANAKTVEAISARLGVEKSDLMNLEFVAGTMFFAKTKALLPLLELGFTSDDFEAEAGQVDGTLAHAIERAFSVSAKSVNMTVSSFNANNSVEHYLFAARSH